MILPLSTSALKRGLAGAAAAVAAPSAALALPFETDDAGVAAGFEISVQWDTLDEPGRSQHAPALGLTWAIAPERLEVSVTTGAAQVRHADGGSQRGLNDTEVGAKWRVRDGGERGLSLTLAPTVVAPSAADGIGDGRWRYVVPVIAQLQRGSMTYVANAGWSDSFAGGAGEVSLSVLAERRLSERLAVGVELFGAAPASDWAAGRLDANLGARFTLKPGLELQALVGRSVAAGDDGPATLGRLALECAF